MIITEFLNDGEIIKHYSDKGVKIRQVETDRIYTSACDPIDSTYTYEETDIPVPSED